MMTRSSGGVKMSTLSSEIAAVGSELAFFCLLLPKRFQSDLWPPASSWLRLYDLYISRVKGPTPAHRCCQTFQSKGAGRS